MGALSSSDKLELQSKIIGAILNKPECMSIAYPYLSKMAGVFQGSQDIRSIVGVMMLLYEQNIPIDIVSITEHLHRLYKITSEQVAGIKYLELATIYPGDSAFGHWLELFLEWARDEAAKRAYEGAISQGLSEIKAMETAKESVASFGVEREVTLKDSVLEILRGERTERILPSGMGALDKSLEGGLKTKQLMVIGGKTGIGKSLLTMTIATNIALMGHKVFVAATEMSDYILARRYISANFNIPLGDVTPEKMKGKELDLPESLSNVIIDTHPGGTIERLTGSIKSVHSKSPLSLVVIDHLQRLENNKPGESQVDFLKRACSSFRNVAMSLDLSMLAVSQFSREASRGKPQLYNYRGSGGIEEEADVGILLDEVSEKSPSPDKMLIVKIAKGRDIPKSTKGYILEGEYGRFREATPSEAIRIRHYDESFIIEREDETQRSDFDDTPF